MKKLIIIVVVLAILLGVGFYFVMANRSVRPAEKAAEEVTLTVWGLWESEREMKPAIEAYTKVNPKVKIDYRFQSSINYRSRVQTQIQAGQGPDVFMIHNTWLPMFLRNNSVAALPGEVMSEEEYTKTYYSIVKESFAKGKAIYGVSTSVDGLAMYYNEELLAQENLRVPVDWREFTESALKLTKRDERGRITQSGAAIGAVGNVDHWSDILGLLFLQQPGASLEKPNEASSVEVVRFYTNFVLDPSKAVWSLDLAPSTQAFASGRVAFYFGPSWRAHEIRALNPQLKFKTAVVPQLPGRQTSWGSFWGFAVSNNSLHKREAWEFLKFLSSVETEKLLYQTAAASRLFGQPYSRVDLQGELLEDPQVGAFVRQAPFYKSWYLASRTFDQDLNDKMIKYYEDALNSVLGGGGIEFALDTAAKGVAQVLEDLNKASVPASPAAR